MRILLLLQTYIFTYESYNLDNSSSNTQSCFLYSTTNMTKRIECTNRINENEMLFQRHIIKIIRIREILSIGIKNRGICTFSHTHTNTLIHTYQIPSLINWLFFPMRVTDNIIWFCFDEAKASLLFFSRLIFF